MGGERRERREGRGGGGEGGGGGGGEGRRARGPFSCVGTVAGEATARSHHGWGGVKEAAKGTKLLEASHWS